jgi:glycosyltransferase involved in cell wall biosynthesis
MKITFLNDLIYDYAFQSDRATWATGGAERQQWLLARALATAGWSVTIGIRRPELRGAPAIAEGVRFVDIGDGHILKAWARFFRAERPDWWFWNCASHLFPCGVVLAQLAGARTIFAACFDTDVKVREALYLRPRWWPAYGFGLARTDRIVVQHHGQQADLPRRWQPKSFVVPNIVFGVDSIRPRAERTPTVAWVAALRVAKRPDRLIAIARQLPDVRFVVCGGGSTYRTPAGYSDRAIEQFRATPNIEYRGQVSPAEAVRLVSESALLLSTSEGEGFPQTFLEAWSYGTPTVTLGIDPDGVISRTPLGAVCADEPGAAAAIASLLADDQRWEQVSENARQYVARAHSPSAAIAAMNTAVRGAGAGPEVGAAATRRAV